jgi:hypothetical protein
MLSVTSEEIAMRHRSQMKCEACGEHPVWHYASDANGDATLECGLCCHHQMPRVTKARIARREAEIARLNAIMAKLGIDD